VRRAASPLVLLAVLALALAALWMVPAVRAGLGQVAALLAAGDLPGLREYLRGFGVWAPLASALLMQLQALIAPLPSLPLMYANGLLFGTWWGGLLSWASILGSALLCFGLARLWGRPLVERLVSPSALAWVDTRVLRYGAFAVFLTRLTPLTSFDLLSYAAGLTSMRLGPFSLATALGMAPAIFLVAAAGELGLTSYWALLGGVLGLAGLAVLGALVRPVLARRRAPGVAGPS
jgi:uncharacterized membrane protein YdjX (TVP38/TMEM64 family)